MIRALGGNSQKYKRDRAKALRAAISQVYSPPRVTAATKLLPELRLIPGFALDLTVNDENGKPYDFDDVNQRNALARNISTEKPMLLITMRFLLLCGELQAWQEL